MNKQQAFMKLWRFAGLYGWRRAVVKAVARTRPGWLRNTLARRRAKTVSLIGCGQFAFSSLCFFVQKNRGNVFLDAFDVDLEQARSLSRYYGFTAAATANDLLNNPAARVLYVASNHASHTDYAIGGLRRGLDVYVEKPVSVTYDQFVRLSAAQQMATGRLFAGYNRPYAAAIQTLRRRVESQPGAGGFSLNYFISGHQISADHWYRHPNEGTRVCGNLGHWIDLTVYIWQWRGLPSRIAIQLAWANPGEPDDNLCVTFTTDRHDVVSMMLTARSEPFEGINEAINLQYGDLIARIDDFRSMTIWQGSHLKTWRYRPKELGHERAAMQPFRSDNRAWADVALSTLLMLHLKDMVLSRQTTSEFCVQPAVARLEADSRRVMNESLPVRFL